MHSANQFVFYYINEGGEALFINYKSNIKSMPGSYRRFYSTGRRTRPRYGMSTPVEYGPRLPPGWAKTATGSRQVMFRRSAPKRYQGHRVGFQQLVKPELKVFDNPTLLAAAFAI